jgi:hypothetical protein
MQGRGTVQGYSVHDLRTVKRVSGSGSGFPLPVQSPAHAFHVCYPSGRRRRNVRKLPAKLFHAAIEPRIGPPCFSPDGSRPAEGDWEKWLSFFVEGVRVTAEADGGDRAPIVNPVSG